MRAKQVIAAAVAVVLLSVLAAVVFGETGGERLPGAPYVSVLYITGTVGYVEYDIFGNELTPSRFTTSDYLDLIADDENNLGVFLVVDSNGGYLYDADRIYQGLMEYKERTGRPIRAACVNAMHSAAYYIASAADYITAERTADVGSIGVYIEITNISELCDKLGISVDYIRSSENKAMGNMYNPMTEEQRAIYQESVDESYRLFCDLVQRSRGYTDEELAVVADGRSFSAARALELRLIDEICNWDDSLYAFEQELGAQYRDTIDTEEESWISALVRGLFGALPKSDLQMLQQLMERRSGEVVGYGG